MADDDLLDIKYQLKKWENSFVKKNNRKPNKVCVSGSGAVTVNTSCSLLGLLLPSVTVVAES